ncbi:MAG: gliding motility-associated C-terminal domain-containing protein, partial [Bacteroidetes bacterium]|nr:gliding motility-associated C-terminal domain-containing protein [Bacteroidota bacterium]
GEVTPVIVVSPISTTTYVVTVTNNYSCSVSDSATVVVNPTPSASVAPDSASVCEGNSFPVSGTANNGIIHWMTTGSGTFSDTTIASPVYNPGITDTGYVTLMMVVSNSVCPNDTATLVLYVSPNPVVTITVAHDSLCSGDVDTLTATGIGNYLWNPNGEVTPVIVVSPISTTTYVVTVTNNYSCSVSDSATVVVNPTPSASVAPDSASVCEGNSFPVFGTANNGIIHWTTTGSGTFSDTTIASPVYNPGISDTGYVTLMMVVSNSPCPNDTAKLVLYVSPNPVVTITVAHDSLCSGDVDTLTATGIGNYLWSPNGEVTPIIIVNPSVTTTYVVTITNSYSCSVSDSATVVVNQAPTASAIPDSASVCQNSAFPISGTASNGIVHWSTSGSGTFSDTTIASPVYNPGISDTGYVTLMMVVSNPPCANDTAAVVLYFTATPTVAISATRNEICMGDSDTLVVTGGGSYLWAPGGETTAMIIVSPFPTTTYTVTVTNGVSCISTDSITIIADSIPFTSQVVGRDTVCENDTNVVYWVLPATGFFNWTVTGGIIVSGQGSDSILVNWGNSGTGIVTMVDTNAAGCSSAIQTMNVWINPVPITSPVLGPDSVCANSVTSYSVTSTAGSSYIWTVTGGSIIGSPTGSFISVTWGSAGIGFISVIETNSTGCNGLSQSMVVMINPVPVPVMIFGNPVLCEGDTIQVYSVSPTPGSTYNWSVNGGTLVSGQGSDSATVNWGVAGTGSLIALETNQWGCTSDTATFTVLLNPHPVATALPDSASVCQNGSFPVFGTTNANTIRWITSGTGTFSDTTLVSPIYSPGNVDTGYVTLSMIVSSPPCADDTATLVVYISLSPAITLTASQNTICFGDSATLAATGTGIYLWSPGGDTTTSIIVHPQTTTTYSVTVSNGFGCSAMDSLTITVVPPGIPNAGPDQVLCIGDSAHLTGTIQNAGGLLWSTFGDGTFIPNTNSFVVTYAPGTSDSASGGTWITLTTTGACLNLTDTVHISVNQFPTAFAGNDTLIAGGPTSGVVIPLIAIVSNVTGGMWTSTGTGTFSPSDTSLNATYTPSPQDFNQDSIIITLVTSGGCKPAGDFLVVDFTAFSIPNVITPYPNTPGKNDFFYIKNLPSGSKLKIWDRWGMLVFVSDDYRNDWDAAELKSDTYYYILTTEKKEYHGWIKVIRE